MNHQTVLVHFPPTLPLAGLAGPQSQAAPWWWPRAFWLPVPVGSSPELIWEAGSPVCTPIPLGPGFAQLHPANSQPCSFRGDHSCPWNPAQQVLGGQ